MPEPDVRVGDVWKDRDKRGGPTFRVTAVLPKTGKALVENTANPARPRSIKLWRFPRDYELIDRPEVPLISVTEWAAELLDSVRREHGPDCPSELLVDALPAAVCEELAWRKRRHEETHDA